jgi:hypothetical protein
MKKKGVYTLLVPNGITSVDGIIISIIIKSRMISIIEYHYTLSRDGMIIEFRLTSFQTSVLDQTLMLFR